MYNFIPLSENCVFLITMILFSYQNVCISLNMLIFLQVGDGTTTVVLLAGELLKQSKGFRKHR